MRITLFHFIDAVPQMKIIILSSEYNNEKNVSNMASPILKVVSLIKRISGVDGTKRQWTAQTKS
jgi:hypothetical protein